jgi:hypothetical protein
MSTFVDRLAELVGVLIVAYTANESFRAAALLAVALLGALVGLALRVYAQPSGGAAYGPLR